MSFFIGCVLELRRPILSVLQGAVEYRLLLPHTDVNRAFVGAFIRSQTAGEVWRARLITIDADELPEIASVLDVPVERQLDQGALRGLSRSRRLRSMRDPNQLDCVERRLNVIRPVLDGLGDLLKHSNPDRSIREKFKQCSPAVHPSRAVLWLLRYLAAGRDDAALSWGIGSAEDAMSRPVPDAATRKRGRKGLAQYVDRSSTTADVIRMVDGYLRHRQVVEPLSSIHALVLANEFGVRTRQNADGTLELYHPDAQPFPTFDTWCYHVRKALGRDCINEFKLGGSTLRDKAPFNLGSAAASALNLMQRVQADAQVIEARAHHLDGQGDAPALWIVRRVDVSTSLVTGVGFAVGAESNEAYIVAEFSEAIPKSLFCALVGVECSDDDWPSFGCAMTADTDRGPGAARMDDVGAKGRPSSRGMAPTYSGQSKATVESAHRRTARRSGKPMSWRFDSNILDLMRKEVVDTIRHNRGADVSRNTPLDIARTLTAATPIELAKEYARRGRVAGIPVTVEDAVRRILPRATARIDPDGVHLDHFVYRSESFARALLAQRPRRPCTRIDIWYVPGLPKSIWAECAGELFQLSLPLDPEEALPTSQALGALKARTRYQKAAAMVAGVHSYDEHDIPSAKGIFGRSKKPSAKVQAETNAAMGTKRKQVR